MGYVKKDFAREGTEIFIDIRNNKIKAKVVKFPFYK
jgi:aminomethyltransferase